VFTLCNTMFNIPNIYILSDCIEQAGFCNWDDVLLCGTSWMFKYNLS
jgi:hypothetical protein